MSIARHTSYNLAGTLAPIAVSLVLTPILVSTIGLARYGLLSIYLVLLGYFGLFDFGTGRAVAQRIAALRRETAERRNRAFWTSLSICLALCLVAAVAVSAVIPFVAEFLHVEDRPLALELQKALYWLVVAVPLAMIGSQFTGALEGAEQFGFVNAANTATSIALLAFPLGAALTISRSLEALAAAATVGRLLGLLMLVGGSVALLPIGRPNFDRADVGKLLSFGGWSTVSNVIGPILLMFDRFLIGKLISAAATGIYALPYSLMSQLQIFPNAMTRALFPRIASSHEPEAAEVSSTALTFLNFAVTAMLAMAAPILLPFLCLWLGWHTGLAASPVAYALLPGIWANSLAMVAAMFLQARANTRFLALVHLAEVIPYLFVLYAAVRYLGITGAALAWSARCIIDAWIILRGDRVKLDRAAIATSAISIASLSAASLLLPPTMILRWALVVMIASIALWQAWRTRPVVARDFEQRLLSVFRGI